MRGTVLTDQQILLIMSQHINHDNDGMRVKPQQFARAIEQAVLQSLEVQALHKDAEMVRMAENKQNAASDASMEKWT